MLPRQLISTLFPYTTLFRSDHGNGLEEPHQIITVIDSNNLEHDGRPKTASHFSASCSGVARPDMMLSAGVAELVDADRKSTRLNSSHANISYAVFCLKKKKK